MELQLQAPITVQLEIGVINDANGTKGLATFAKGKGRFLTDQELRGVLADFVENHMPEGFRLMTKREWFNEEVGQAVEMDDDGDPIRMNFAMPGGEHWAE